VPLKSNLKILIRISINSHNNSESKHVMSESIVDGSQLNRITI